MEYDAISVLRHLAEMDTSGAPEVRPYGLLSVRQGTPAGSHQHSAGPFSAGARLSYLRPTLFQKVGGVNPDG